MCVFVTTLSLIHDECFFDPIWLDSRLETRRKRFMPLINVYNKKLAGKG